MKELTENIQFEIREAENIAQGATSELSRERWNGRAEGLKRALELVKEER